jgi:hypothetical protein
LDTQLIGESAQLADVGQANLAALLLNSGLQSVPGDPVGLARQTAAMFVGSSDRLLKSHRMSFWS